MLFCQRSATEGRESSGVDCKGLESRNTVDQPCHIRYTLGSTLPVANDVCGVSCLFSDGDAILRVDWRTKPVKC